MQNTSENTDVVTQRSMVFYSSILFIILLMGGMAVGLMLAGIRDNSWGKIVSGIPILLVTYYYLSRYYRITPIVRVNGSGVTCNREFYAWNNVSNIQLTGSQPMEILGGKDMEGTSIVLNNERKIILLHGMYANLDEVRRCIVQVMPASITMEDDVAHTHPTVAAMRGHATQDMPVHVYEEGIKYVKGNSVLNMYGILTWFFVLGALSTFIIANNLAISILSLLFAIGFGLLFSRFLNYYGISDRAIIVRNYYRPWKKQVYPLADIREIVLARNQQSVNVMRLTFHDYRHKELMAAGLSDENWLAILNTLRAYGVPVKDENNYEELVTPESKRASRWMAFYMIIYLIVVGVVYAIVESLDVSETMLIVLKIGWLVFSIILLFATIILILRHNTRDDVDDTSE